MKSPLEMTDLPADECADCPLDGGRRTFFRQAGLAAVGLLLSAGLPDALAAMTPTSLVARGRTGGNPIYPIPLKDGVQIDKENDVILVRWEAKVMAFNLSCPHQNTALRWNEKDAQFQCPKHHSKYTPDGTFISGRATRNMDRFTLARMGDAVVVNTQVMHKNDKDPTGWSASVVALPTKG
ncbi:MAG: Rieske 2Fe-2S domain-containing protein [Gemmatimonadota bacterium]